MSGGHLFLGGINSKDFKDSNMVWFSNSGGNYWTIEGVEFPHVDPGIKHRVILDTGSSISMLP